MQERQGQPLRLNWCDLMLWAVICGQPDLAKLLWGKVGEPLRAALIASRVCQRLAKRANGRKQEKLQCEAAIYEGWACDMLDAATDVPESDVAMLLLGFPSLRVPQLPEPGQDSSARLTQVDKWIESPLELAVGEDGFICKRFLSNKLAYGLLDNVFNGFTYELDADLKAQDDDGVWGVGDMGDDNDEANYGKMDDDYFEKRDTWLRTGHMASLKVPFMGQIYVPSKSMRSQTIETDTVATQSLRCVLATRNVNSQAPPPPNCGFAAAAPQAFGDETGKRQAGQRDQGDRRQLGRLPYRGPEQQR